jgi:hypothetical protein
MAKADRVLSTPPTHTPTDTTRRHLLTIAAGGAVAAVITTAVVATHLRSKIRSMRRSNATRILRKSLMRFGRFALVAKILGP